MMELPVGLKGLVCGDYVQQTMGTKNGSFRLPWYAFPPDKGCKIVVSRQGAYRGTYFGPVHEVRDSRDTKGFVSIRVPTPFAYPSQLVWINVLKRKKDNWQSCERVNDDEVRRWVKQGWQHKFIEG